MNIKRFIDRPLLSIVINVMVVAVGIITLTRLPIEKLRAVRMEKDMVSLRSRSV